MSDHVNEPILSEAVEYNGLYYLSGQIGTVPETGAFAGNTIEAQAAQVAGNIEAVLRKLGMTMKNILKANCYLTDMANYESFNETYKKFFISRPARTCVAIRELPFGALCEIEVIAAREHT